MDLYVWNGEAKWGLPSMDLNSLQMLSYVKFSGAPVTIHKVSNPYFSPTGSLPSFKGSDGNLEDFASFTACLRKQNYSCDYELSPRQCSEVIAYENLLKEKLYPALIYLWWVEPKTYYEVIHKWYYQNIPFPFKLWYPGKYHKINEEFIEGCYEDIDGSGWVETELHKQAQECLTMLSNRLGEKDFFFGSTPSTLDALVFSYLVLLLKVDIKVCDLQNYIKACPNLTRYVNKILQRYYPSVARAELLERKNKSGTASNGGSGGGAATVIDDVPNKGRNLLISGLIAAGAMCTYAVATGLVQVDMGDDYKPTIEEDDYYDEYEDPNQGSDSGGED